MSRRLLVFAALVVLSLPQVGRAAEPVQVVINGKSYASWTAYFRSSEFHDLGLRCGTKTPWERAGVSFESYREAGGEAAQGTPGDCSMELTNPTLEYEPAQVWEITVVVHRLESALGQGVFDDSLVATQITVLNEDYRGIEGTPGAPGYDTRIQFRLATQDPEGNPSPGWTRTTNEFWFNDLPDPLNGNYWDALAWDPTRYLNIYTMSPTAPGGVILGYVPYFPQEGAGGQDDGVRCLWNAFGRTSANAPYDQGRTVTHEVGHYLGLYHAFQDGCGTTEAPGCYSTGDRICDTEPDAESHGGCPVGSASCGLPDPIRNYMEYTEDACMTNFTLEQARRMRCAAGFYRASLYRTVTGVEPAVADARVKLDQNHPNPFGRSTALAFEMARTGAASLVVLDVAGRVVRTLVAGEMSAGRHEASWDGTDDRGSAVAPGVFFYRLSTPEGIGTRRMVMLK